VCVNKYMVISMQSLLLDTESHPRNTTVVTKNTW